MNLGSNSLTKNMNLVFQFVETSLGLYINFNPILKKKKKKSSIVK